MSKSKRRQALARDPIYRSSTGKLRQCPGDGIVAFCLFPVEAGDGSMDGLPEPDRFRVRRESLGRTAYEPRHLVAHRRHQASIVVATFVVEKISRSSR
jgi:hypothetical protein